LHDERLEQLRVHGTVLDVEVDGPAQQANARPRLGCGRLGLAGLRGAFHRLNRQQPPKNKSLGLRQET
jgi:hypothetical protein